MEGKQDKHDIREQGSKPERYVIGIDVGGTKIAAGLMDREARVLERRITHAHAGNPPGQVIEAIVELVNGLRGWNNVIILDIALSRATGFVLWVWCLRGA